MFFFIYPCIFQVLHIWFEIKQKCYFKKCFETHQPTMTFILGSDSCTYFSQSRGRDSAIPFSGYLINYVDNWSGLHFFNACSLESLSSQEVSSPWSAPTATPVKPFFLWSTLHDPIVIFTFIRMGEIGRARKNAYISLNTAFLLLLSANSVNPFSSSALNEPSERPLVLLPIKAKGIR